MAHVYLASASPRRRELLAQIGVTHTLLHVAVDETPQPGEDPTDYVARLALAKARAGRRKMAAIPSHHADPRRPVLGADTAVVVDGTILGKPQHRDHGLAMLEVLSGREHRVLSAVALVAGAREALRIQESGVCFRTLSAAQCQAYWDTGEPADKAGGYGIQGRAGAFVRELRGSYSGVMGLPLYETAELLQDFGIPIL